jgi:hypothetical protein
MEERAAISPHPGLKFHPNPGVSRPACGRAFGGVRQLALRNKCAHTNIWVLRSPIQSRLFSRRRKDGGGCVRTQGFAFTPLVARSSDGTDLIRRRSHKQVFVLRLLVIMLSSGVAGAMRTGKTLTNR